MPELLKMTQGDLVYEVSPQLQAFPHVRHAFFTRSGGVSAGDQASLNFRFTGDQFELVKQNYDIAAHVLGHTCDDVARTYIRLCGFEPDVDIKIVYTGLRPGEKMYEELLQAGEDVVESGFQGILIGQSHAIAPQEILHRLQWLGEQVEQDPVHTPCYIAKVVPTYQGKQ